MDPVFVSGSCHKRTGSAALRACLLLIILCSIIKVPPPSLGIRVIGVNMIHGVPDKLNIYVKRVLEGSVAGLDGRIKINDHIVEVRRGVKTKSILARKVPVILLLIELLC